MVCHRLEVFVGDMLPEIIEVHLHLVSRVQERRVFRLAESILQLGSKGQK